MSWRALPARRPPTSRPPALPGRGRRPRRCRRALRGRGRARAARRGRRPRRVAMFQVDGTVPSVVFDFGSHTCKVVRCCGVPLARLAGTGPPPPFYFFLFFLSGWGRGRTVGGGCRHERRYASEDGGGGREGWVGGGQCGAWDGARVGGSPPRRGGGGSVGGGCLRLATCAGGGRRGGGWVGWGGVGVPGQVRGDVPGRVGDAVSAGGGEGWGSAYGEGAPAAGQCGSGAALLRRGATVEGTPTTPLLTRVSLATPARVVPLSGPACAATATRAGIRRGRPAALAVLVQCRDFLYVWGSRLGVIWSVRPICFSLFFGVYAVPLSSALYCPVSRRHGCIPYTGTCCAACSPRDSRLLFCYCAWSFSPLFLAGVFAVVCHRDSSTLPRLNPFGQRLLELPMVGAGRPPSGASWSGTRRWGFGATRWT